MFPFTQDAKKFVVGNAVRFLERDIVLRRNPEIKLDLRDHIVEASIYDNVLGSDHCPVSLVLDV